MIKLKDILNEMISEMGSTNDWGVENVINAYETGDSKKIDQMSLEFTGKPSQTLDTILKAISELEKDEFDEKLKALGLYNLEEACWDGYRKDPNKPMKKGRKGNMVPNCVRVSEEKKKGKVNPAYLTKDAAEMKKDIKDREKLKSDDPAAYGKWDADYSDEAKTKKYKTRKSAATVAYQKRFGKKEK
jgi:hypothetical protein